jgi:hypothetical protein
MIPEKVKRGRPRTLPDLICEQCAKAFRPHTSGSRFCSKACFGAWHSANGTYRAKKDAKVCPVCGKTFYVGGLGSRRTQKLCSLKCAGTQRAPAARKMTEPECAWLAGLFDGEGSVVYAKRGNSKSLRICISNTNEELLARILEVVGTGTLVSQKRYAEHHAPAWVWQCYSANARDLLEQMLPWLIVKREKALTAINP